MLVHAVFISLTDSKILEANLKITLQKQEGTGDEYSWLSLKKKNKTLRSSWSVS